MYVAHQGGSRIQYQAFSQKYKLGKVFSLPLWFTQGNFPFVFTGAYAEILSEWVTFRNSQSIWAVSNPLWKGYGRDVDRWNVEFDIEIPLIVRVGAPWFCPMKLQGCCIDLFLTSKMHWSTTFRYTDREGTGFSWIMSGIHSFMDISFSNPWTRWPQGSPCFVKNKRRPILKKDLLWVDRICVRKEE